MLTSLFGFAFILMLILPTLLLVFIAQKWLTRRAENTSGHSLVRFILLAYLLVAVPFIVTTIGFRERNAGILLVVPPLDGLLALLILNWRQVFSFWQAERRQASLLLLALPAVMLSAAWINPTLAMLLLLPSLLAALIWTAGSRLGASWLAASAILVSVALFLDSLGIAASHAVFSLDWLRSVYQLAGAVAGLLALALAALCVQRAYRSSEDTRGQKGLYLLLAVLLVLGVAAVTFRHGVLTNATGRAYEDHLPFALIAAGLVIGFLLSFDLPDNARRIGVGFFLLTTVVIIFSYSLGWQVDFEAVTASRAERLQHAISQYRQDTGQYPSRLAELTPGYLPLVFGPLSGRGQEWCYQSGPDFYRLGYVYYQRYYDYPDDTPFWEPFYEIKVPYTAGQLPQGEWICDQELELFKKHRGL